jgi:uncharacterized protein (DUF849 family)
MENHSVTCNMCGKIYTTRSGLWKHHQRSTQCGSETVENEESGGGGGNVKMPSNEQIKVLVARVNELMDELKDKEDALEHMEELRETVQTVRAQNVELERKNKELDKRFAQIDSMHVMLKEILDIARRGTAVASHPKMRASEMMRQ